MQISQICSADFEPRLMMIRGGGKKEGPSASTVSGALSLQFQFRLKKDDRLTGQTNQHSLLLSPIDAGQLTTAFSFSLPPPFRSKSSRHRVRKGEGGGVEEKEEEWGE